MDCSFKEFYNRLEKINSEATLQELCESSDLTYYELRKFLQILSRVNKDPATLRVINSLIQTLSTLELRNVSIPTVKRLSKKSKKIFK